MYIGYMNNIYIYYYEHRYTLWYLTITITILFTTTINGTLIKDFYSVLPET